jgi:hypothetical protein
VKNLFKAGLLLLALSTSSNARAAGGAHIVDDSEVETPGHCHVELWVTRFVPGNGYANAAPACTPKQIPFLEVGVAHQDYWSEENNAPILGPTAKLNLRPQSTGLGLGIAASSGVDLSSGDLNFASVVGLVSVSLNETFRVNLNAGWSYVQGDMPDALFYGGQIEVQISRDLMFMIEGFGRAPGIGGVQTGLRFTPKDGPIDFELLAARFLGENQPFFFTVGVIVRF